MDIVEAWAENERMERLQDYLKRGRKLADVPLEELRTRWMALIREEAENTDAFDHGEEQDIRSEMAVRKVEPPFDLVRDALDAMKAKAKERWAKVQHDPSRALQFELELRRKLARFEADSRRRTS
jgi:hypothetical protein